MTSAVVSPTRQSQLTVLMLTAMHQCHANSDTIFHHLMSQMGFSRPKSWLHEDTFKSTPDSKNHQTGFLYWKKALTAITVLWRVCTWPVHPVKTLCVSVVNLRDLITLVHEMQCVCVTWLKETAADWLSTRTSRPCMYWLAVPGLWETITRWPAQNASGGNSSRPLCRDRCTQPSSSLTASTHAIHTCTLVIALWQDTNVLNKKASYG